MFFETNPRDNRLLAMLPDQERERLLPHLERAELPLGKVLYESGSRLSHVYFPTTSIVSLLSLTQDGASAEIAVVGSEGVVGIALFMGGGSTTSRAIVQSGGEAFRLRPSVVMDEFNRQAVEIMTSDQARQAFDLAREDLRTREVTLVALAGKRTVYGFRQDVMGKL